MEAAYQITHVLNASLFKLNRISVKCAFHIKPKEALQRQSSSDDKKTLSKSLKIRLQTSTKFIYFNL